MNDDATTKPGIKAVLERINALDGKIDSRMGGLESRMGGLESRFGDLDSRISGLESRIGGLESEVAQMRQDINTGFRKIERKIEILNDNMLTVQADHRDLLIRVENLESKAS